MDSNKLEKLFEAFYRKRHETLNFACSGTALSCLNANELKVLHLLQSGGTTVMSRLSEESGLAMSTLTGITDKLSSRGLISRARDEKDRRIVQVKLSKSGLDAVQERSETKQAVCRDILSGLSDEEKIQFLSLMEKIVSD